MAAEYGRELERVRRARADFEASQDEVDRRKQEYFVAVRTLHEAGMPLREIASALGLSHQRVHQMVDEATGKTTGLRRRVGRAAKQGGIAVLLIVLAGVAVEVLDSELSDTAGPGQVTVAPSHNESRDDLHQLRKQMIELSCAQKVFEWHQATREAFGDAAVVVEPTCTIGRHETSTGTRSEELEAELRRQLQDLVITIRERA